MYGSIPAAKFIYQVASAVPEVIDLVDDRIYRGFAPEDPQYPLLVFAIDQDPIDIGAVGVDISAQQFRFRVEFFAEGESVDPLIPAAVALHVALYEADGNVDGFFVTAIRTGELPDDLPPTDGIIYVHLGGYYQVDVTAGAPL